MDPPYNVPIDGHASGNGRIHHRDFAVACGEMSSDEFRGFLHLTLGHLARWSVDGAINFVCMDWRHLPELFEAGRKVYSSILNLCVWSKDCAGLGSFYRSQHELIAVYRFGSMRHQNNVQLGRYGRNRSNIWSYPSASSMSRSSEEGNLLAMHPTVKPVAMVADAFLDCTAQNDIVLDSFLGSGTTLLAAERTRRVCFGMELDPFYVDLVIRRWQKLTGDHAIHAVTGRRFDDVASEEASHG